MKRNQSGFTLIEIAIVLVIIGLLLGGVLKGQELINSAKVKNLATDFRNIPVFIYGYQDKYRAFPGDDKEAVAHLGSTACAATSDCAAGNGDGILGGSAVASTDTWDSDSKTDETQQFWLHVRIAGLAPGPTSDLSDYRPNNALGGSIGIQSNSAAFSTIVKNDANSPSLIPGTYVICSKGIQGKFVKQLDSTMDDGNTDTGAMRATDGSGTTTKSIKTESIKDGDSYIVCMGV